MLANANARKTAMITILTPHILKRGAWISWKGEQVNGIVIQVNHNENSKGKGEK